MHSQFLIINRKSAQNQSKHKSTLLKLEEKDPEFFKFLKENDEELLEFDESDDDDVDNEVNEEESDNEAASENEEQVSN